MRSATSPPLLIDRARSGRRDGPVPVDFQQILPVDVDIGIAMGIPLLCGITGALATVSEPHRGRWPSARGQFPLRSSYSLRSGERLVRGSGVSGGGSGLCAPVDVP